MPRDRGAAAAWTRCPESRAAPPFWAVTHLADQLRAQGVVDTSFGGLTTDAAVHERFGLYRAIVDALRTIERPLLLVIDDLQWADPDSLRVLEHISADLSATSTLVLATTRPLADDSSDAFVDCLAEIARVSGGVAAGTGRAGGRGGGGLAGEPARRGGATRGRRTGPRTDRWQPVVHQGGHRAARRRGPARRSGRRPLGPHDPARRPVRRPPTCLASAVPEPAATGGRRCDRPDDRPVDAGGGIRRRTGRAARAARACARRRAARRQRRRDRVLSRARGRCAGE